MPAAHYVDVLRSGIFLVTKAKTKTVCKTKIIPKRIGVIFTQSANSNVVLVFTVHSFIGDAEFASNGI